MKHFPYLIVGAGPAGLQLSYLLKRAGLGHGVVERAGRPGSFYERFPRHRTLLSINKVHTGFSDPETNLRWDWNSLLSDHEGPFFRDFSERYYPSADDLLRYLGEFERRHQLDVEYGFDAVSIERKADEAFVVRASDGRAHSCDRLIIATGTPLAWWPDFEGVDLCESYVDVSVDPKDFEGERVLIVGKGNSAFETAENLIETTVLIHLVSPRPIRMAWQTHFVGHLRAVNNNLLDTYQLKLQNAVLDAEVRRIRRVGDELWVTVAYAHAQGEVEELVYDRVLLCTGFRFDASVFASDVKPECTPCGRLPLMTEEWESLNVRDLFFAGTLTQSRDYKRYMSAFIHGFRYNALALTQMLQKRYHGIDWPCSDLPMDAERVTESLLQRVNQSSALWQQPGFFADVVALEGHCFRARYMEQLPLDYAKEQLMHTGCWLSLTLEYGEHAGSDPFRVDRVHREDVGNAHRSTFLHPVVRYHVDGAVVSEHHVLEDLAARWQEPEHIHPLRAFVGRVIAPSRRPVPAGD